VGLTAPRSRGFAFLNHCCFGCWHGAVQVKDNIQMSEVKWRTSSRQIIAQLYVRLRELLKSLGGGCAPFHCGSVKSILELWERSSGFFRFCSAFSYKELTGSEEPPFALRRHTFANWGLGEVV
jgi:hypothetical protein